MRKLKFIIPIVITLVTVLTFSLTTVFAQGNEDGGSNASKLAIKVAEILGLDAAVVDDAIKRAREELRGEVVQKKLNAQVEKGQLTQEQADQYLDGKHSLGKKGHHRGWKGHGGFFAPGNYFKGERSLEDIQKKLNAMVETGDLTQEEAEAKLKKLQTAKAD